MIFSLITVTSHNTLNYNYKSISQQRKNWTSWPLYRSVTVNESFPYYGMDLSGRLHSATFEYFRLIEDNRKALLKCCKMLPYTYYLLLNC